WSAGESSTVKSLGTSVRSRLRIVALLSTSRWRAAAISTGWTALRKARAKAPVTAPSRRFSKRCSTPAMGGHLLGHADIGDGVVPLIVSTRDHIGVLPGSDPPHGAPARAGGPTRFIGRRCPVRI